MSARPELLVLKGESTIYSREIGDRPLHIGRAPSNDLILIDDHISWRHAMLWTEDGKIWIKDLGSTNGTFVDGERLKDRRNITEGVELKLGTAVQMRIRGAPARVPGALMLEDLTGGIRISMDRERLYIGSGADCDLVIPEGPARAATLIVHLETNEVWLGTEDDVLLAINEPFDLGGRQLRIVETAATTGPTFKEPAERPLYPYRLTTTLRGPTGPKATLENLEDGTRHTVGATNRAILLYLLGKRWKEDQENGAALSDRGWCGDDEIASGIWGRNWREPATNHLHVLVHRTRKEFEGAGFDPWFIEKRRRYIRARLQESLLD